MTTEPIDIGSRLELLVDDYLIANMQGTELRLHRPVARGVCIVFDRPWEGNGCGYVTVFQDGDLYRMYYKSWSLDVTDEAVHFATERIGYAESDDGIVWRKPSLGLFEVEGSTDNNIVWADFATHGWAPFRDPNPDAPEEMRYKALGHDTRDERRAVWALASPDGLHWSLVQDDPVLTGCKFDSQNLCFFDTVAGKYRAYMREFRDGVRDIKTATSDDMIHWTEPEWLEYPGAPVEQLYTNCVLPYPRAPHILMGFPTRYVERQWGPALREMPDLENREMRGKSQERYATAITDGVFMTSRDGQSFKRWGEAFVRPDPERPGSWAYGSTYLNWGIVQTRSHMGAADELSFYPGEGYWTPGPSQLRRYTLRMDGFVSAHAPRSGGELITKPLTFAGGKLMLNYATSAAGSVRVEMLDPDGRPIEGFALTDCDELFGDEVQRAVTWNESPDVSALAGQPVRLRLALCDADLYSFRFAADE